MEFLIGGGSSSSPSRSSTSKKTDLKSRRASGMCKTPQPEEGISKERKKGASLRRKPFEFLSDTVLKAWLRVLKFRIFRKTMDERKSLLLQG